jgi:alpha-tubulin suppressor-like RCC1 family protein
MGEVYQGSHPILDKKVAIKILSEELSQYPELVSRFRREARAIARIKHPAIVEAFDFGNLADGRCYYVMELLQGTNLATFMQAKGALSLSESLEIAIPLMEGLAAAHEAGFIHRDIKPDNIFLVKTDEGTLFPKLIDFGIAKLKNPDEQGDSVVTRIDAVMGTPLYMSPEQAPGSTETVGPWSDIYSTAATLYHVMSGKPPFYSDNPLELMLMHSWSPPPPLCEVRPEVPQPISDTIMKALSKKPADRFPTMQGFAEALRAAAQGRNVVEEVAARADSGGAPGSAAQAGSGAQGAFPPTAGQGQAAQPSGQQSGQEGEKGNEGEEMEDTVLDGVPLEEVTGVPLEEVTGVPLEEVTGVPLEEVTGVPVEEAAGGEVAGGQPAGGEAAGGQPAGGEAAGGQPAAARAKTEAVPGKTAPEPAAGAPVPVAAAPESAAGAETGDGGSGTSEPGSASSETKSADDGAGPPTLEQDVRGGSETSLSGVASEMVMEASPPDATLYRRRRPWWPWVLGGGGAVAAAVLAFVLLRGEDEPAAKPVRWTAVHSSTRHACGIRDEPRHLYCWGRNNYGQLGTGDKGRRTRPARVENLGPVLAVATGGRHTCAVLAKDRTVRCWGKNEHGQLGDGSRTDRPRPVAVPGLDDVIALATGASHTCALQQEGSLRCWGKNDVGQLGIGKTGPPRLRPAVIKDLKAVVSLSAGGFHSCALTANDSLWCWGKNDVGQLGVGKTGPRALPTKVQGLAPVSRVDAAGAHTCAVDRQGAAWCWGANASGQLGNGETKVSPTPVRVKGLAKVTRIAAGGGYLGGHSCVVTRDKQLHCWGHNLHGQAGKQPSQARLLRPSPVKGLGPVTDVTAGGLHTCALDERGRLLCFGRNGDGQLGDGTRADRLVPTVVEVE